MLEFKESANNTLTVIPAEEGRAIGTIGRYEGSKEYCFRALVPSFYVEELRQIADKLDQLNSEEK